MTTMSAGTAALEVKGEQGTKMGSLAPKVGPIAERPKMRFVALKGGTAVVDMADDLPFSGVVETAGGELPPMADWQQPGDVAWGVLVGKDEGVGPNESRVYRLRHPQSGVVIGVWGTSILDRAVDQIIPSLGDQVCIVYLGDVDTSRGQNPAKLFRVAVKRANGSQAVVR